MAGERLVVRVCGKARDWTDFEVLAWAWVVTGSKSRARDAEMLVVWRKCITSQELSKGYYLQILVSVWKKILFKGARV